MAISEIYSGSGDQSSGTWQSGATLTGLGGLPSVATPGVYQVYLYLNILAGDTFVLTFKDKITSGGTQQVVYSATFSGVQSGVFVSPAFILYHGWDIRLQQTVIDQSFAGFTLEWSIRKIA